MIKFICQEKGFIFINSDNLVTEDLWKDGLIRGKSILDNDFINHLKLVSAIFYQIFIFSSNDSSSKNYEKCFLFHLKSSFRSRDIQIFVFFFPSFPHFPDSKGQMEVE